MWFTEKVSEPGYDGRDVRPCAHTTKVFLCVVGWGHKDIVEVLQWGVTEKDRNKGRLHSNVEVSLFLTQKPSRPSWLEE